MSKVWFARKQNGEVITLTEVEALTHFERNNISNRMRLVFLGTSDGMKMKEASRKAQDFLVQKLSEEHPNFRTMSREESGIAKLELQDKYRDELRKIQEEGFNAEFEQAKLNGVKQPDPTLRIITKKDGGTAMGSERQKIINSIVM